MTTTAPAPHRWMPRLVFGLGLTILSLLAVAIILVALPVTRGILGWAFAGWLLDGRLESLAVDLDIQPNLRWIFTLLVLLPVGFGVARMLMARQLARAVRGFVLAAGAVLALGTVVWWQTRHFNFDAQGRPVVYLSFRRDGVHKSYTPGIDRVTGRLKYQATVDRVQWLTRLAAQPVREVDPATHTNWFDANSGEPNVWYVTVASNQWHFFNRPHFHQQLRVEVKPITPELMARWSVVREQAEAAAQLLQRLQDAEAKAAALEQERQARARAEQQRQTDLRIRAEAEAKAAVEKQAREARDRAEAAVRARVDAGRSQGPAEGARREREAQPTARTVSGASRNGRHSGLARATSASAPSPRPPSPQPGVATSVPIAKHAVSSARPCGWMKERVARPIGKIVIAPFKITGSIMAHLVGVDRDNPVRTIRIATPAPSGPAQPTPAVPATSVGPGPRSWSPDRHVPPPGVPPSPTYAWSYR